jgi:hypothetical protein
MLAMKAPAKPNLFKQKALNRQLMQAVESRDEQSVTDLIAAGANPNTRNQSSHYELDYTPLFASTQGVASESICKLLLHAGAQVNTYSNVMWADIREIIDRHSMDIASNIIFAPNPQMISDAQNKIMTMLLCIKRCCPSLPKDIRNKLLAELPTHDLGTCMIAKKLRGQQIPPMLLQHAIEALHECTFNELRHVLATTKVYFPNRSCTISPEETDSWSATPGNRIRENIITRLAQEKLLCNGVVGETDPVPVEQKSNKCTVQ